MRFHLWIGEPRVDLFVECVDDLDGRVLWRTHATPTVRFIAWHEVANRGDVRQCRQPRCGCDRQSTQSAGFNVTHCLTRRVKHHLNLSSKQIGERGAAAAIMYWQQVDTRHHLEQFTKDVWCCPDTSCCHIDLAWICLGISDQLGNGFDRERWIDQYDIRHPQNASD